MSLERVNCLLILLLGILWWPIRESGHGVRLIGGVNSPVRIGADSLRIQVSLGISSLNRLTSVPDGCRWVCENVGGLHIAEALLVVLVLLLDLPVLLNEHAIISLLALT